MSMGYGAGYADVIDQDNVRKFVKKEFDIFMGCIEGCELDLETFAHYADTDNLEGYDEDLVKAYENLCEAFEKKKGLSLHLNCHSKSDEGDRYDGVDGAYWSVGGMYQLTSAGKKMKNYVDRKMFVQFG